MKKLVLIIIMAFLCLQLGGCFIIERKMAVQRRSDIRYSEDYDPDPNGYLRHDGKYYYKNINDTTTFGPDQIAVKILAIYFFKNGSFYINSDIDPDSIDTYPHEWKVVPPWKYGIYEVIDSTMVKVNMYDYNNVLHMHDLYTMYYQILNDTTIRSFMKINLEGRQVKLKEHETFRFVKTDTMPKFDIPIERYGWMRRKKAKK